MDEIRQLILSAFATLSGIHFCPQEALVLATVLSGGSGAAWVLRAKIRAYRALRLSSRCGCGHDHGNETEHA